ncbi:MAG: hypothetical protein K2O85_03160, partial [Helicobacter sp.]|nr:hypothetical protein [Helicobacter sp.]
MKKILFAIIILLLAAGIYAPLTERFYDVDITQQEPLHIALLSDVHSGTFYLPNLFEKLKNAQQKGELDAIFLVGDIIDDEEPIEGARVLLE